MTKDDGIAGEAYCYITTRGRVSGKPHTVEIWFALEGRTLYVLAGGGRSADFVKNAMRSPSAGVRIGSMQLRATARIVDDPAEDARARQLVYDKYAGEYGDLEEWRRTALPVAFDLERG